MSSSDLTRRTGSYGNDVTETIQRYRQECCTSWNPDCHNVALFSTAEYITSVDNGYFVGFNTKDYHARKRKGELLPMTPWKHFTVKGKSEGTYNLTFYPTASCWTYIWSEDNFSSYGYWVITEEDCLAHLPTQYDAYVQEAAAKVYSEGHDTLTFLAEITEIRHLFMNAGLKLLKLDVPRNWKALANDYLSYRYGWRTLMFDIKDIYDKCQKLQSGIQRVRRKAHGERVFSDTRDWQTEAGDYFEIHHVYDEIKTSLRGNVIADIDIPQFQFNPFQTAWELIPYSFVLDWFVSVGKTIAAASFLTLQSKYTAAYGFRVSIDRTYEYTIECKEDCEGERSQVGTCKAEFEIRTPCSVPLTPHFTLRLNSWKVLDLLGMIVQKFRR